jgi:hypothetical protein
MFDENIHTARVSNWYNPEVDVVRGGFDTDFFSNGKLALAFAPACP